MVFYFWDRQEFMHPYVDAFICDGWVSAVLSRSYFFGRTCAAMWQ